MEIIIRMEEKENPTVGAALREMASDYWVKTYLPKIIESAEKGKTQLSVKRTDEIARSTQRIIHSSFEKLGIKVVYSDLLYDPSMGLHYRNELVFSWN